MAEDFKKKVDFVGEFFDSCVSGMGINAQELVTERFSPQALGYSAWEQLSAMTDDAFSSYIRLIPCIYVSKFWVTHPRLTNQVSRAGIRLRLS
jgi:hypothetical protein